MLYNYIFNYLYTIVTVYDQNSANKNNFVPKLCTRNRDVIARDSTYMGVPAPEVDAEILFPYARNGGLDL